MDTESKTITLETPLTRGENKITSIVLLKPTVGALRGISMRSILDMDVNAIATALPRISEPPLIAAEVDRMDPADLLQAGMVLASFFVPKAVLEEAQAAGSFPT